MEYQVRPARITDVDRLGTLCADVGGVVRRGTPLDSAGLLRQLITLPQASVFVAEAERALAGAVIVALRPSIRVGGYVGTVDLLVIDPQHDPDRVADILLDHVLRSARNKGCATVEATLPADPASFAAWQRHGFSPSGQLIERAVVATAAPPAR